MQNTTKANTGEGGRKMGWFIALAVVAVLFVGGAICCKTITGAQSNAKPPVAGVSDTSKN